RGDVAPLVTASHLDGAAPVAEQVQEVVRLQQHVAEFGVGNARVEPRFHRLLLQHDVHAEVLSHIAQEVDEGLLDEPIGVVEDEGLRRSVEVEEPRHLVALALQMLADLLLREQRPLAALAARIADQAGAAAPGQSRATLLGCNAMASIPAPPPVTLPGPISWWHKPKVRRRVIAVAVLAGVYVLGLSYGAWTRVCAGEHCPSISRLVANPN